jgi:hypothetical protein
MAYCPCHAPAERTRCACPNMMKGYRGQPEKTAEALRDANQLVPHAEHRRAEEGAGRGPTYPPYRGCEDGTRLTFVGGREKLLPIPSP